MRNGIEKDFERLRLLLESGNRGDFDPSASSSRINNWYTESRFRNVGSLSDIRIEDENYLLAATSRINEWYIGMMFRKLRVFGHCAHGEPLGSLTILDWVMETEGWENAMDRIRLTLARLITRKRQCWSFGIVKPEDVPYCVAQGSCQDMYYKHRRKLLSSGQGYLVRRLLVEE